MRFPSLIASLFLPVSVSLCTAQIDSSATNPDSLLKSAYRYLAHENTDSARILFNMVISSKPHAVQAQLGLIQVKMAEEDWWTAVDLCDRLLKADPNNIEAHFFDGMCEREKGAVSAGVLRWVAWLKSSEHFEAVIAKDSLYKDVLYQFVLLKEYKEDLPGAFALADRQVQLRPELAGPLAGLLHLYRHYISLEASDDALRWLQGRRNDFADYFAAEVLRRDKQFMQAETTLYGLLKHPSKVPPQAYYLSLAHMYAIADKPVRAQECYWKAVDGINSWLGGTIVFEDLKYVITDNELVQYSLFSSDRLKKAFFHRFWGARDPMPATAVNYRLIEHLQRYVQAEEQFEYYGLRVGISNPDWVHVLRLPKAFRLNKEFNDLGLVFMRQGPPNKIERTMGNHSSSELGMARLGPHPAENPRSTSQNQRSLSETMGDAGANTYAPTAIDPHQSWIYFASGDEPQRILHFALHNTSQNYWRLTPLPGEPGNLDHEMLGNLAMYDAEYLRLDKAPGLESTQLTAELQIHEKEAVATALTTDRHVWSNGTKEFSIPHAIDAFRNPGGGTLLDVSYAISYAPLREAAGPDTKKVSVEVGISSASHTSNRIIDSRLDTLDLLLTPDGSGSYIGLFRQVLVADSVRVTAHVRALGVQAVGTWSERRHVPAFTGRDFMLSDLQFLVPATDGPLIEIDGVKVQQSPFKSYSRTRSLYAYVQVYNLVKDMEGKAGYTAKFLLAPKNDPDNPVALAEVRRDLTDENSRAEFQTLNISGFSPGMYVLTVAVTDRKRVQTLTRSREIDVTR